ncbi:hypothetical protein [Mucilaginibacter sp. UR6-11]|uniref:hypothetical protein n=1 Tax=Mucilaginibacter sp. UR6-11 TaxID=1435644 RepID=UPI001E2B061B|nr:hypothetical protein [Mucilaginibacter sp. UR6-11]MCC8427296.1 hypothetical protein [Mucilaginibacter sp. UR6-11]
MTKRLAYIVMLLIFVAGLSSAKTKTGHDDLVKGDAMRFCVIIPLQKDTTKRHQPDDEPKKIKEISKAKRQAKPEKIIVGGDNVQDSKVKPKPKRERRPEGLDRPPEIPRRNGN